MQELLAIGLKSNIGDHEFLFRFLNPHTRDVGILSLWPIYGVGSPKEVKRCMVSC